MKTILQLVFAFCLAGCITQSKQHRDNGRLVMMEGHWESNNVNVIRCSEHPYVIYVDSTDGKPDPMQDQLIRFSGHIAWHTWPRSNSNVPPSVPPDGFYLDWKSAHWTAIDGYGPKRRKADQPATRPADIAPADVQPPPTTSKDGPG